MIAPPRVPSIAAVRLRAGLAIAALAIGGRFCAPPDPGRLRVGVHPVGCSIDPVGEGSPCRCAEMHPHLRHLWGWPLDVNHATAEQLAWIGGIGPARAAALVAARPFDRLDDLERVPGIGPAIRQRLASGLYAGVDPVCGSDSRPADRARRLPGRNRAPGTGHAAGGPRP